jgi:TnpA family transposase
MAHRTILTERQRAALFDLPTEEAELLQHYTLADDDLEHIHARRQPENRIGFALQLCALRYPGRLLSSTEMIPENMLQFIAAQLGLSADDILIYAARRQTRQQHLQALRQIYGFRMFSGRGARRLKSWLEHEAETAPSNVDLARRFVEECRRTQTILPGVTVIERRCADALVAAERRIESRITSELDKETRKHLDGLLTEIVDGTVTRFVWLRQFEVGNNSAGASRLLDRLEYLQALNISPSILDDIPPHRVTRLRRQGERYFADGLRDITSGRRLAILAVCAVEWTAAIADTVVETHDRIVGKTWRDAKKLCDVQIADARASLQDTLRGFKDLGAALLEAKGDDASLDQATETACGWARLETMVATASELTNTMAADALAHVVQGYHRFRRYAPRMLRALELQNAPVAGPLIKAAEIIAQNDSDAPRPRDFLRKTSKWHRHLNAQDPDDIRLWEVAVLFQIREAMVVSQPVV